MARTTQITVPQTALTVGPKGPFTSGTLPSGSTEFIVTTTPLASAWPASGDVISLTLEESPDNGVTWQFSASQTLSGGQWLDKSGAVMPSDTWITTFMFAGAGRKIRLSANVLQACTLAATLEVQ